MTRAISSKRRELAQKMAFATALMEADSSLTLDALQMKTGLSKTTLMKMRHGKATAVKPSLGMVEVARKSIEQMRDEEAHKLSQVTGKVLDHLLSDDGQKKIEKAGLRESAGAVKDMVQQRELLTGRPTSRHEDTLSDAELLREIRKAKDELARQGGFAAYANVEEAEYTELTPESLPESPGGALEAPRSDEALSGE